MTFVEACEISSEFAVVLKGQVATAESKESVGRIFKVAESYAKATARHFPEFSITEFYIECGFAE